MKLDQVDLSSLEAAKLPVGDDLRKDLNEPLAAEAVTAYPDPGVNVNEMQEALTRELMVAVATYAESGQTFDPSGHYLCGTCIMRQGSNACTHVVGKISLTQGSCNLYLFGGDQAFEPWYSLPSKISQKDAGYVERPESKGFGCFPRCGHALFASQPDSDGRDVWCSFWGTHVLSDACCIMENGSDLVDAPGEQKEVHAYGTAEGAVKGWDARGRGRKEKVGGHFRQGSAVAIVYQRLADNQWHHISEVVNGLPAKNQGYALQAIAREGARLGVRVDYNGSYVRMVNTVPVAKALDVETVLTTGKIKSSDDLGGGVNKTQLVVLDNGVKAVYKEEQTYERMRRDITSGMDKEREAAAWQVAKLVGMDDLVVPSVVRGNGSMSLFQQGQLAANMYGSGKYDGNNDLARAAVFDYVIGNTDRHGGNWLVNDNKLRLIDHGLSFPERGQGDPTMKGNSSMVREASEKFYGQSVSPYTSSYISSKDAIISTLKGLGLDKAIPGVSARIDALKSRDLNFATLFTLIK